MIWASTLQIRILGDAAEYAALHSGHQSMTLCKQAVFTAQLLIMTLMVCVLVALEQTAQRMQRIIWNWRGC